jgi:hypothetical protein
MFRQSKAEPIQNFVFVFGLLLLVTNIIGWFHYTTIDVSNHDRLNVRPKNLTEKEFWKRAYRKDGEKIGHYIKRLTNLVSDRMIHVDPKYAKPTFFGNYILWAYAQYLNQYEWKDSKKSIRLGGGFCSQHAIVFDNILKEQGITSRILGLNGHVLNEVVVDGKWKVYDPQHNVIFAASMKELENDSRNPVYVAYKNIGLSESDAKHFQEVFTSDVDNWHYKSSKAYSIVGYIIEKISFYLIWIIPLVFILTGVAIRFYSKKRFPEIR